MTSELPPCPDSLVDDGGVPRFGAFVGRMRDTSLVRLSGAYRREGLRRLATEKWWHDAFVATPGLFVGGAVVQLGYLASAFLYVFDRHARRMLAQRSFLLPAWRVEVNDFASEARATARGLGSRMRIEASAHAGRFAAELSGGVRVELWLHPQNAPLPLTAVCPVGGGGVAMTQKTACVPADGEVRARGRTHRMTGALAGLDYSHGYLARETRWRWASASGRLPDGRAVGFNLVQGHNDGEVTENGLWIGGRLVPVGHARFDCDENDPSAPWGVQSEDGRVDVRFVPEGMHGEDVDLKIIASQYVQPMGTFEGTVRGADGEEVVVAGIPGVVERYRARW